MRVHIYIYIYLHAFFLPRSLNNISGGYQRGGKWRVYNIYTIINARMNENSDENKVSRKRGGGGGGIGSGRFPSGLPRDIINSIGRKKVR